MRPKTPMKGEAAEELTDIQLPCFAFAKIDGFRCGLDHAGSCTSRMVEFPNAAFRRATTGIIPPGPYLDGELVVGAYNGEGVLGRTSTGVTTKTSPEPDWTLWVFDCYEVGVPFQDRYDHARMLVRRVGHPRIKLLPCKWIETLEELEAFVDEMLALEFEGIITRSPHGLYKLGKSTLKQNDMTKVKPFIDQEGEVIGYFEEEENTNVAVRQSTGKLKRSSAKEGKVGKGTLGGLILRDLTTDVTVRVGGGFTKEQRKALWKIRHRLIGQVVTYKKQKMGQKDKPRHPVFKCFRPGWDFSPSE